MSSPKCYKMCSFQSGFQLHLHSAAKFPFFPFFPLQLIPRSSSHKLRGKREQIPDKKPANWRRKTLGNCLLGNRAFSWIAWQESFSAFQYVLGSQELVTKQKLKSEEFPILLKMRIFRCAWRKRKFHTMQDISKLFFHAKWGNNRWREKKDEKWMCGKCHWRVVIVTITTIIITVPACSEGARGDL